MQIDLGTKMREQNQYMVVIPRKKKETKESGNSAERELRFNPNHDAKTGRFAPSGGSSVSNAEFLKKEADLFDSIRNKKKENLIVYDNEGNVLGREGNISKSHTGYEEHDYKGNNAVHNHPDGVGYYPSDTDLDNYQRLELNTMSVVSPTHTIKISKDPEFSNVVRGKISSTKNNYVPSKVGRYEDELKKGTVSSFDEWKSIKASDEVRRIVEAGKREGYIVEVSEVNK